MDDPASPQTAVSSTSFVSSPAPSPSSSQRLDPIRRKPVPTGYPERDDKGDSTLVHSVEGDETLLGGVESRDGHTEGAKEKGKAPATEFSPHDFRRPSTESAHSFPPPASRTSFQYIPNSLPSPASAYSYAPTSPLFASPPTAPAPIPTPASLARGRTSYQDEEQKYAGLTSRPSLHSQRSSVAPENVFGTPPVGTIGINKPREVVRVERDYTGGELPFFWSGWIFELEGRLTPTEFQNTLNELNAALASANDPWKSCFDNCLAILTLYISPLILSSHYEREMKKFDRILERANRDVFNPAGLNILSPRRNAFLFLEIEYY